MRIRKLFLGAVLVLSAAAGLLPTSPAGAAKCVPLNLSISSRQLLHMRPCVPCPDNLWICPALPPSSER